MPDSSLTPYAEQLSTWKRENRLRGLHTIASRNGPFVDRGGQRLLNLSSNDYLGFATDTTRLQAFYAEQTQDSLMDGYGLGSSASRLMTGSSGLVGELEALVGDRYARRALVLNSGYHANIGILPALTDRHDLILADKLCHASLIDGFNLGRATFRRYRHLDYEHCAHILTTERDNFERVFIVTESIFSMDGDVADLEELVRIKERFGASLYVDEAHATGVRGEAGLGLCEEQGMIQGIEIIVGTFGKALASVGAYVAADAVIIDYLVNSMRPFIFTTALPPVVLNWNLQVFQALPTFTEERHHLRVLSDSFRQAIRDQGLLTCGSSQIIPIIVGENAKAVTLGDRLLEQGYLALPIRPPTVPEGQARIRMSLTANMQQTDLVGIPRLCRADPQNTEQSP